MRNENWNVDEVPASAMLPDTSIRACAGFTLGINVKEGNLGSRHLGFETAQTEAMKGYV
jgi:hypothetical protein